MLIKDYENTTLWPNICTTNDDTVFLRMQISLARALPLRHQTTFLCHAFDAPFGDNLNYCTKILQTTSIGSQHIGILLFQIDNLLALTEKVYQTYPHLTDMLIMSGLR